MSSLLHRLVPCMAAALAAMQGVGQQPFGLDPTFRTLVQSENVASILPLEDGNVILSGRLRFSGDLSYRSMAMVDASGAQVQEFLSQGGGGKIVPWEDRLYVRTAQSVRRFLLNGQLDQTFIQPSLGPYFGTALQGGNIHVYPDGRVLLSGTHNLHDSIRGFMGIHNLVWLSNQGYLDTTRTHRKSNATIWRIFPLPDGKFLLSGYFTVYEGQPVGRVIRVHPDGALDTTFQTSIWWGFPDGHLLLENGKHLLSGAFQMAEIPGDTVGLVRLMPNGELDTTFNNQLQFLKTYSSDPSFTGPVSIMPLWADRYIITGSFDRVDGLVRGGIALVDTAGYLTDELFTGDGCGVYNYFNSTYGRIGGIVPASDGNFFIYGAYHGYDDGTTHDPDQRFVSRLYGLNVGVAEWERITFKLYPNPSNTQLTVELEEIPQQGMLLLRDALGRAVRRERITGHYHTLGVQGLPAGLYLVEVHAQGKRVAAERLVVE